MDHRIGTDHLRKGDIGTELFDDMTERKVCISCKRRKGYKILFSEIDQCFLHRLLKEKIRIKIFTAVFEEKQIFENRILLFTGVLQKLSRSIHHL